jgi:hypothetical protein
MTVRICKITYLDAEGIEHTVSVNASSLYEAVGQRCASSASSPGAITTCGAAPPAPW